VTAHQTSIWSQADLTTVGDADELQIAPRRGDGTLRPFTTIWTIRAGDTIVIRSFQGPAGGWYRRVLATGQARIRAGGVERDVDLRAADTVARDEIDAAYRAKYGHSRYLAPMLSTQAAAATLQLSPHGSE
jgi:hypothetical protein